MMVMSNLTLSSSAFENNMEIPQKFGYKHGNSSPPLSIQNVPENCKSLALIMDDPDAMGAVGKVWVHWLMWNIPPNVSEISESTIPDSSSEGVTDFGEIGYGGPAPPDKKHTYVFKLYALDTALDLKQGATKSELEDLMKNHVISQTTLKGTFAP